MSKCPCCGAPYEAELQVDLNTNTILCKGHLIKQVPAVVELAKLLCDCEPGMITFEALIRNIWGVHEPNGARQQLSLYVSQLRRTLIPFGVNVECVNRRGYRLVKTVEGSE